MGRERPEGEQPGFSTLMYIRTMHAEATSRDTDMVWGASWASVICTSSPGDAKVQPELSNPSWEKMPGNKKPGTFLCQDQGDSYFTTRDLSTPEPRASFPVPRARKHNRMDES